MYPENIAPDTPDGVTNVPYPVSEDPNVVITTTDAGAAHRETVFNVPEQGINDPRVDHILGLLDELNAKVEHLLEHAHKEADCCEPPVQYEGHVVLHPVSQPPAPDYNDGNL